MVPSLSIFNYNDNMAFALPAYLVGTLKTWYLANSKRHSRQWSSHSLEIHAISNESGALSRVLCAMVVRVLVAADCIQ